MDCSLSLEINANGNRRRSVSEGDQKRYAFGVRLTALLTLRRGELVSPE